MATYKYDPYGNLVSSEPAANSIGAINPIRYRGYYYDTDSQLYYLQSRYYDPELGRFLNADAFASTGQGIIGTNMFAYCGNDPVNFNDPSGCKRKIWYILFQEHQSGYIHTQVQLHILAVYNVTEGLYRKEFVIPGIGRADIVKPSTGEAWEVKHGGGTPEMEEQRIADAQRQLSRYTVDSTGLHPGSAGEFEGFFTLRAGESAYAVIYITPDAGVILYYLIPLENVKKTDFVFAPSSSREGSALKLMALAFCFVPVGPVGGGSAVAEKAYGY